MAETVKIAEIDIGVDSLIKKAGQTKKRIAELKAEQKELKKATDDLSNATEEQLSLFTQNEVELKNLGKQNRTLIKTLDAYINIQNEDIKTKEQARDANLKLIAIANQLNTADEEQAKLLKQVNAEIDKNTEFIKENSSEYEKTKINIGNYKGAIIDAFNETAGFNIFLKEGKELVATFGPVFSVAGNEIKEGAKQIRNAAQGTEALSKSQKAAAVTTNVLTGATRLFGAALIATGIGAILVLLGSLVAYFKSTQEGIDKVNSVLTPMRVLFQSLLGVLQEVGKRLANAFTLDGIKNFGKGVLDFVIAPFKIAMQLAGGFAKIIKGDVQEGLAQMKQVGIDIVDGFKDGINSIKEASNSAKEFYDEAISRGQKIADLQIQIEQSENRLILTRGELNKLIKAENKIAEDVTKTILEREAAAQRSIEFSEQLLKAEQDILDLKIEQKNLENQSNDTSRADQKELNELIAERNDKETQALELQTTQQNKLNIIRQQANARAEKERQRLIELSKIELDIFIQSQGIKSKTLKEQYDLETQLSKERLEIYKKEIEGKENADELYRLAKIKEENALGKILQDIAVEAAQKELTDFVRNNQTRIEQNKFLSNEIYTEELNRLNAIAQKQREFFDTQLQEGVINQTEYNQAINDINDENQQKLDELKEARDTAEKEKQIIDLENQRLLEEERFNNQFELQKSRLEAQRLAEVENAEQKGADITLINKRYAELQKQIDEDLNDAKLRATENTFGNIAQLFGESTAAGKAAGIAQAYINTYQGVTEVWKAPSVLPEPFNTISKITATATTLASGIATVNKIKSVRTPRAERGISFDIQGKTHAQGGETFYDEAGNPIVEAQHGEKMVILNQGATRELNMLSSLNQKHGGVSLSKGVSFAENGGAVVRSRSSATRAIERNSINADKLAENIGDKINSIKYVVPVDRVSQVQTDTAVVEAGANH